MKNRFQNYFKKFSHEPNSIYVAQNIFAIAFIFFLSASYFTLQGCKNTASKNDSNNNWKEEFKKRLPLVGHRNWILVVDKAFPMQSSFGIEYFNTQDSLLTVLDFVVKEIKKSNHVAPVFYLDKELDFVPPASYSPQQYKKALREILKENEPKVMLHDAVFKKIDATAKLFTVLILKTEQTIPYSSVFIELGCKYWNQESEDKLRLLMKDSLVVKE